jgi:hypothetical protein
LFSSPVLTLSKSQLLWLDSHFLPLPVVGIHRNVPKMPRVCIIRVILLHSLKIFQRLAKC